MNSSSVSNKHKHLEFVQAAVNRMASNLFLLKGWSITLIAALFALAAKDANKFYILIAYFPLFIFWTLDGYFLSQERKFRALLEVAKVNPKGISNSDAASLLGLRSDYGGGSKDYLSYSVIGILMREGKLERDKSSKKHIARVE
jgi:hypothetical protein